MSEQDGDKVFYDPRNPPLWPAPAVAAIPDRQTTWDVLQEFALAGDAHAHSLLSIMRVYPGTVSEAAIVRVLLAARIDVERRYLEHMHNCMRPQMVHLKEQIRDA